MPRAKATEGIPAYTFRMDFLFDELTCWREIRVPKSYTFEDLHLTIQATIGWDNSHLYEFRYTSKKVKYIVSKPHPFTGGDPTEDAFFLTRNPPVWRCSWEVPLSDLFQRGKKATYTYDFGDMWQIEIVKTSSTIPLEENVPVCLAGEGVNPPDDIGGEWGLIRAIEHQKEIDEPDYEPAYDEDYWEIEPFDLAITNKRIHKRLGR